MAHEETEQKKLGQTHGITQGFIPSVKALLGISNDHLIPKPYGDHAELLGVGAADAHHPRIHTEVGHGR